MYNRSLTTGESRLIVKCLPSAARRRRLAIVLTMALALSFVGFCPQFASSAYADDTASESVEASSQSTNVSSTDDASDSTIETSTNDTSTDATTTTDDTAATSDTNTDDTSTTDTTTDTTSDDTSASVSTVSVEATSVSVESTSSTTYENVYRLYNPYSGEHHFTTDQNEVINLTSLGWKFEGIAWVSPTSSSVPVYRLYNPYSGDHHYTTSSEEYEHLGQIGWKQEGIAWYSDTSSDAKDIYRLFNPYETIGTHHYTTSSTERDALVPLGWRYEGVGWRCSSQSYVTADPFTFIDLNGDKWSVDETGAATCLTRLQGIDISHHQSGIDVASLSTVDFVIVKATQGTTMTDSTFVSQAKAVLASGKLLGVYHYASPTDDSSTERAIAEADYFVDTVQAAGVDGQCIYFLDWERDEGGGYVNSVFSTDKQYAWCKAFLDRVAERTGSKPMIYMSQSYARYAVQPGWSSVASSYDLWVARYPYASGTSTYTSQTSLTYNYTKYPVGAWSSAAIWQYTSTGSVTGYSGDLDLDIFYGNRSQWLSYE